MQNICNSMRNYPFLITRDLPSLPRCAVGMLGTGRTGIGVELAEVCPTLWGPFPASLGSFPAFWGPFQASSGSFPVLWGHSRYFLGSFPAFFWGYSRLECDMGKHQDLCRCECRCRMPPPALPLIPLWHPRAPLGDHHSLEHLLPLLGVAILPPKMQKIPRKGWNAESPVMSPPHPAAALNQDVQKLLQNWKTVWKGEKSKKQSSVLPLLIPLPRSSHCSLG